jgi:biotin carboxyl carrier protein
MTTDVVIRGRRRTIEVRKTGPDWEMALDGRILGVNVTPIDGRWSLLIGPEGGPYDSGPPEGGPYDSNVGAGFSRPVRSYEVAVDRGSNGERIVHVNGVAVPVTVLDPRARRARTSGAAPARTGTRSIVSPMPGRIVKVLVKTGDTVAAHQGLVVVEAMKMENELKAPHAARVIDVKVVDGMSVEANAVLVMLE